MHTAQVRRIKKDIELRVYLKMRRTTSVGWRRRRESSLLILVLQVTLLSVSLTSVSSSVVLRDNGYEGVVVALEDSLPVSVCQQVLQGLEVSKT